MRKLMMTHSEGYNLIRWIISLSFRKEGGGSRNSIGKFFAAKLKQSSCKKKDNYIYKYTGRFLVPTGALILCGSFLSPNLNSH